MKKFTALIAVLYILGTVLVGCAEAKGGPPEPAGTVHVPASPVTSPAPSASEPGAPAPAPAPPPTPTPKPFSELAPTTHMSFEELVGDNGIYEFPESYPPASTYRLVVDIYHQVVMAFSKDQDGKYTVPERYMVCTSGASKTPTPIGTFKTGSHKVRFGLFVSSNVYGQYWTQVTGRIYFHSLLYTNRNANTYTSSSYKLLGKRGSHGCIRLLVPDARWVFYHIAPGTTVEIRRGSKSDQATAKIKEQLTRAALPKKRPKLVPGKIPNTDNWTIEELKAQLPLPPASSEAPSENGGSD